MMPLAPVEVRIEEITSADPVAVRELRVAWPGGVIRLPYLLFRTRYGYHATCGWEAIDALTPTERVWLLAHVPEWMREVRRDAQEVADAYRDQVRGGGGIRAAASGNGAGSVPPRSAGVPGGDPLDPDREGVSGAAGPGTQRTGDLPPSCLPGGGGG